MIPGWSPIKVVQTVPVGCISRSRDQKIGFQNAIFKNLLVRHYKAQSFHFWYISSSRGPLSKLFKLCPWGQNWLRPGGHNFTLNYIRKTSNEIFSWTAYGNWIKLHRNDSWVVFYQSCSKGSSSGFQNAIFKNIFVWKYKTKSFHIWGITSSRGPLPILGGQHKWSSVNGSTVTFDPFLRWATQSPLGPLLPVLCEFI